MERYFEINENGHNIRCKLYCLEPRGIRKAVIFCHGFGGHKDNAAAARFAEKLLAKHKTGALITFDLPCHGKDVKKKLTLEDCGTYLDMVIRHVRRQFTEEIYAYATSFGGYLTLKYIMEQGNPFRKILLRSPAVNLYEAFTRSILGEPEREALARGREVQAGFDRKVPVTAAFLQALEANDIRKLDFLDYAEDILILHGTKDEIIDFEAVRDFSEEQLIELILFEGADHRFRDPKIMDLAIKRILEFYKL